MPHPPAPADHVDALVARRARWRADSRRPLERSEPRIGSAHHSQDADILEVVQKFERVYSQFSADQRDTQRAADALAVSSAAATSPERDRAEGGHGPTEPPLQMDAIAIPVSAEAPLEKFELPEEPILQVTEHTARLSHWQEPERRPRRLWPRVLAGAALALVIGIGVGYVMVPNGGSTSARAKIESSPQGGTRLRVEYELQKR